MNQADFLRGVGLIAVVMAVSALLELVAPMAVARGLPPSRKSANLALGTVTILLNAALTAGAGWLAGRFPGNSPALMTRLALPLQLMAGIVVLDFFFGYFAHRAMHASALLWRFHRVHHADPHVDVTTTYRTHPVETLWRFAWMMLPAWVLGVPGSALVVYRLLSAVNGIFEHANIRIAPAADSALSLLWVTPNMHKIHHSRQPRETDTNYGNLFAVHDRMLGTFTPTARAFDVRYGLEGSNSGGQASLLGLLVLPWRQRAGQWTAAAVATSLSAPPDGARRREA
ncbi:MAG TPA: sterol desaturase family protein [Candidatus Binatia bacterium]|jgi:sterol desaturase/sphingolipid hydroxylase (fatty acid hydroxylase superfamily)